MHDSPKFWYTTLSFDLARIEQALVEPGKCTCYIEATHACIKLSVDQPMEREADHELLSMHGMGRLSHQSPMIWKVQASSTPLSWN